MKYPVHKLDERSFFGKKAWSVWQSFSVAAGQVWVGQVRANAPGRRRMGDAAAAPAGEGAIFWGGSDFVANVISCNLSLFYYCYLPACHSLSALDHYWWVCHAQRYLLRKQTTIWQCLFLDLVYLIFLCMPQHCCLLNYFTLTVSVSLRDKMIAQYSYSYSYRFTLFNELFSEESCSVIGLSEKMYRARQKK